MPKVDTKNALRSGDFPDVEKAKQVLSKRLELALQFVRVGKVNSVFEVGALVASLRDACEEIEFHRGWENYSFDEEFLALSRCEPDESEIAVSLGIGTWRNPPTDG